jgi:hypothetical protein
MNRHRLATALVSSVLLLATGTACSDDASPSATTPGTAESEGSPTPAADSSEPAESSLEGEWSAVISAKAARATLRRTGFGDVAEKIVTATPWGSYDLRIAGGQLLLFDPNGEVMDDGAITLKGERLILENSEVPGRVVLRVKADGTTLHLWFVSQNRPVMESGLTDEPFVRMFYATVPWTRAS